MTEQVKMNIRIIPKADVKPPPIFANHVQVVGIGNFATVNFYSGLFERADQATGGEVELEARLVAQVVLPAETWAELLQNASPAPAQAAGTPPKAGTDQGVDG